MMSNLQATESETGKILYDNYEQRLVFKIIKYSNFQGFA